MVSETTPSKVIRTDRDEERGLPIVCRIRKRDDGTTFTTTERPDHQGFWVVNSEDQITRFNPDKLRDDIISCYGKLYTDGEHLDFILNKIAVAMVSLHQKTEGKKAVSTKTIEQAALLAMEELPIPQVVSLRFRVRYCINSMPEEDIRELITSISELDDHIPRK